MKQLRHHEITNIITTFPIIVICDNFRSPQNVGMAFRICENMGVQHLYLTGICPVPPNKKIKNTARNADKLLPYRYEANILTVLHQLRSEGYTLVGIEITDKSQSLHEFVASTHPKIAIILGSERTGIADVVLQEIDHCIHIPMFGQISSMNVIMALSISLYEITKQLVDTQ